MTKTKTWTVAASLAAGALLAAPAQAISPEEINGADFEQTIASGVGMSPVIAKAQILLDRAFFSPAVTDGYYGGNTAKALRAFQYAHGLPLTGNLTQETWRKLTSQNNEPVIIKYTITEDDVNGPFEETIPDSLKKMADMERIPYHGPEELLAEKFHMDQDLLAALNPNADMTKAGTEISVANVRDRAPQGEIAKIVVDRSNQTVKPYASDGSLIAFYPATVGSDAFPSPSGTVEVNAVAKRPTFTYSGDLEYADLPEGEKIVVPPGPNNPVGIIWIDLSKDGYGIHGTPTPSQISKQSSHGCVRLTNWDATELGDSVETGTPVEFTE